MQNLIFQWIGAIISFLVIAAIACACLAALVSVLKKIYDLSVDRSTNRQIVDFGRKMQHQDYWFSANPREAEMWKQISECFRDGRRPDASIIRDRMDDVPN